MRADRLVATLLVLQARGRVTAATLATELEISERTARRDLEALAMAGVPVYSQPGRGGGWSLVGGARTDLSGLTAAEVRTLFLVAGPAAGTPEVRAALRKLVRAIPEPFRAQAEAAASAVVLDPTGWDHHRPQDPPHLATLQAAVIDGVQVVLAYAGREGRRSERTIHPLGLVAKGSVWYLIAGTETGPRTFRVGRVQGVEVTERPVVRPEGFDLEAYWRASLARLDEQRVPCVVILRTDPGTVSLLRRVLGLPLVVREEGPDDVAKVDDRDDRVEIEMRAHSPEVVAAQLAGFGGRVEVMGPVSVRQHLARIAAELAQRYEANTQVTT